MNIWRLITHHINPDEALIWIRKNGRIAIGWGAIGDIGKLNYSSASAIGAAIRYHYPHKHNSGLGGPSLWNFYDGMSKGDLVILSARRPRALVVEVLGKYEYVTDQSPHLRPNSHLEGDYQHQRLIQVSAIDPEKLWHAAGARPAPGQNIRYTLMKCARPLDSSEL